MLIGLSSTIGLLSSLGCGGAAGPAVAADAGHDDRGGDASVMGGDAGAVIPEVPMEGYNADTAVVDGSYCFDGLDNDRNGLTDCADTGCASSGSCCFGHGSAICCQDLGTPVHLDFSTCTGLLSECLTTLAAEFGPQPPLLEMGTLVPNGDLNADSGVTLSAPFDTTTDRITIRAMLAAPPAGCGVACLSSVGIALSAPGDPTMSDWTPDAAIRISASRGDLSIIASGVELRRFLLPSDQPIEYTLVFDPAGTVSFSIAGQVVFSDAPFTPRHDARISLFGRTTNRPADAPPPARAISVAVDSARCEMPAALTRTSAPVVPGLISGPAHAPSVTLGVDGAILIAYQNEGAIQLLREQGEGYAPFGPMIVAPDGSEYADPALLTTDGTVWLYLSRITGRSTSIIRAVVDESGVLGDPLDVTMPIDGVTFSQVSVVRVGAEWWMAAFIAEPQRIVWLRSSDGADFAWAATTLEASSILTPGMSDFDRDQIEGPALIVDGRNIVRLYYAGRRGTRWSIGMLPLETDRWQTLSLIQVLGPAGAGFDALGVSSPAPLMRDHQLAIFYEATDGVHQQIGVAEGETR